MITEDQLEILRDIFNEADDDWLLSHISLQDCGNRDIRVTIENANWQDYQEIFEREA